MGRVSGRTKRGRSTLASQTVSEIVRGVADDFSQSRAEQSARMLVRQRGQRLGEIDAFHQQLRREHEDALKGPRRDAATAALRRLTEALKRPRGQPAKFPHLDRAMLAAIARGESPTAVVTMALMVLRSAWPEVRVTAILRRRFLERLKKHRQRHSVD